MAEPGRTVEENATLLPCQRGRGRLSRVITRFGLMDGNGRRIRSWPLLVSLDTSYALNLARVRGDISSRLPNAIYGGLFFDWFGHFITETLPNLIAVADCKRAYPDVPIIFHLPDFWKENPEERPREYPFHQPFLDMLGLQRTDFRFVRAPISIDNLHMPRSPFLKKFRYAPWLLEKLDDLAGEPAGGPRNLYLSRAKMNKPRLVDEPRVEDQFRESGYEIVHPEDMSISDQLALFSGAERIAGAQGTAVHWSLYAPRCKSVISMGWQSPVQKGICKSRKQVLIAPRGKRPKGGHIRLRNLSELEVRRAIAQASSLN